MVKGQMEKQCIIDKIKEVFPQAFEYDKALRIPVGDVQIKVTLTCAKDNVEPGGDIATPAPAKVEIKEGDGPVFAEQPKLVEPSEDELNQVTNLLAALNF